MARIRNIKPEFFLDEKVAELSYQARLLYIGLWTQMDRAGVCPYRLPVLKGQIFPYDFFSLEEFEGLFLGLSQVKLIHILTFEDRKWVFCPAFQKHQVFSTKEKSKPPLYGFQVHYNEGSDPVLSRPCSGTSPVLPDIGHRTYDIGVPKILDQSKASLLEIPSLKEIWNSNRGSLAELIGLTPKRKKSWKARFKEKPQIEYWIEVIKKLSASSFCQGHNQRGWKANVDFFLKPDTHIKVSEGKYSDAPAASAVTNEDYLPLR